MIYRPQENRTVRSTALRAMADIDTALEQEILALPQRQRIAVLHHHREANYLGRAVEITEWITHRRRLRNLARRLKTIYSDNAGICTLGRAGQGFLRRHLRSGRVFASSNAASGT